MLSRLVWSWGKGGVRSKIGPLQAGGEQEWAQEKAEAELGVAPALLTMLSVRSRVVTGDAL